MTDASKLLSKEELNELRDWLLSESVTTSNGTYDAGSVSREDASKLFAHISALESRPTGAEVADEDVARLMKHAHDLERRGRKSDAEITYSAASEIARMRAALQAPTLSDDLEGLVGRLEDFSQGDWSSGQVNDLCAEAASAIRALAGELATISTPADRGTSHDQHTRRSAAWIAHDHPSQ